MLLPDVDQFSVLVVAHTDSYINSLFCTILASNLDHVALPLKILPMYILPSKHVL